MKLHFFFVYLKTFTKYMETDLETKRSKQEKVETRYPTLK